MTMVFTEPSDVDESPHVVMADEETGEWVCLTCGGVGR